MTDTNSGPSGLSAGTARAPKTIFWHRELPPLDAQVMGEHTLESVSTPVPGTLDTRDELWDQCYADLMARTSDRLHQEMTRLGGDYAHVLDEAIETRHDAAKGEAWLRGTFTYVLYGRDPQP